MPTPGAYILGCAGPALTPYEAAFFRDADPWGFILFARNIEDQSQLQRLTAALRDSVGREAPILIDQEGGRVQRMRGPIWREWRPPLDQVEGLSIGDAARSMALRTTLISHELRSVGVDVNCTPMADIASDMTHPIVRNRCYGTDPDRVTAICRAVADAQLAAGVLPILKHIPGHGSTGADSHEDLPVVEASFERLEGWDFAPFRALADIPLGMTAHVVYPAMDGQAATISPKMIAYVRDNIGFNGLLMTDDLSMKALGGDVATRCNAALSAGCDMVLHCNGEMAEMEQVVKTSGHLNEDAARRATAALARRQAPDTVDIDATEAELEALLQGNVYV